MIKNIIDKLLGKASAAPRARKSPFGKRQEVPVQVHGIDPNLVDRRAIDVVETLQDAGYEAYIVGGAVRDLLLGLRPKDFDVATNATPEQVKGLFRRAFIIGKRFRIVHVVHGRGREHEVIEVSTFRAYLDNAAAGQVAGNEKTSKAQLSGMQHAVDASGRVLRDNVWGPQDEDATRRDFTVNSMALRLPEKIFVDPFQGLKDMLDGVLRTPGKPEDSFSDDPLTACPDCGGNLRKLFGNVGVVFKGSGFYITDYRSEGYKQAAKKDAPAPPAAGAESKTAQPATDAKPAKPAAQPAEK